MRNARYYINWVSESDIWVRSLNKVFEPSHQAKSLNHAPELKHRILLQIKDVELAG